MKKCCSQALEDGLKYVWIDTCCIDKRSSAELSEAINSMFRWYRGAKHCYAFLEDVPANLDTTEDSSSFTRARWFKRGWTLQELIAPFFVRFYSGNWTFLGNSKTLRDIIVRITGVSSHILLGGDLRRESIAKRMSWASQRETTRDEDMAYCLLGIFDVNMPLLYGEGGDKAFIRLQEEILKTSLDHSVFAWGFTNDPKTANDPLEQVGVLAESPAAFAYSSSIVPYHFSGVNPFSMTNKGLQLELPILYAKGNQVFAVSHCHNEGHSADELAYHSYVLVVISLPNGASKYYHESPI
jgi:hypothetical protein